MSGSGQKFVARNRAPRVQIEYDVELYGAEKRVQLPFVMGVMADLAGKGGGEQPAVSDRAFLEIDADNFDARMKALAPRAVFTVPNTLTGEGALSVDLAFERMDDFSPAAVARKVPALRALLEAREELATLLTYMDGKSGAEALIERILTDRGALAALAAAGPAADAESEAALASLRAAPPADAAPEDAGPAVLEALRDDAPHETRCEDAEDAAAAVLSGITRVEDEPAPDGPGPDAILAGLEAPPEPEADGDGLSVALSGLPPVEGRDAKDAASEIFAGLEPPHDAQAGGDGSVDALSALSDAPELGAGSVPDSVGHGAGGEAGPAADAPGQEQGETSDPLGIDVFDDLLSLEDDGPLDGDEEERAPADPLEDVLAEIEATPEAEGDIGLDDLDALLDDLDGSDEEAATGATGAGAADQDDLDALLADLDKPGNGPEPEPEPEPEFSEAGGGDDLDALLADLDGMEDGAQGGSGPAEAGPVAGVRLAGPPDGGHPFGTMSGARPEMRKLRRQRLRIALFGDFTGRAARGLFQTGDALAAREGVMLDCDTVEEIVEGFATTLVLPLGKDGAGMEVRLESLDDLHPDELYEKVPLFAELNGLKQQLSFGKTAEGAAARLKAWGEAHDRPVRPPRRSSASNKVRADLRLSDFQKLIGATEPAPGAAATPAGELIARIVGPHVRRAPGADVADMQAAVDEALSGAMRLLLHHPDFQAVEAQWRTLELIARSIRTDDSLEVVLYDVSAEEIAGDLAAHDDLSTSGLARLLTEGPLDEETGRGPFSALVGLYTFEETPPHAELLGRVARIAAHVDAPFIAAIAPDWIDTAMEDRHPLVAQAWDTLRAMPEARHLGLASPRFLLRRPYGARSEPIHAFEFEEFTMAEGLSGMLWANPAALVTILMAQSFRRNGNAMRLGSVMSLGDMPYHVVLDRHGDQVQLPCTERNFTMDAATKAVQRGYMPVLSVKGRDEVRLGSFNAVAGAELLGPWSDVPVPPPSPPDPAPLDAAVGAGEDGDPEAGDDLDDLDDLLASFGDDDGGGENDADMDDDLAALLADL